MQPSVSHSLSAGQNLRDLAHAAHEFLSRNGNTSVDRRILLSQVGAALSHLKPADPSFKWSQIFAAHPHMFQMLDHQPGQVSSATIYALPSHRHRQQNQFMPVAATSSSSALVPAGSNAGSGLALGLVQRGFASSKTPAVKQQVDVKQFSRKTNVIVVLDLSGSMHDDAFGRLTPAKAAIMRLWDLLQAGDSLTIIAFNTSVATVMPRRFKWEPKEGQVKRDTQFVHADLQAVVNGLQAGGGTALYHALLQAIEQTKTAAISDVAKSKSKAASQKSRALDVHTFQLFVITDGMDEDSAGISPASTAQAVNQVLRHPGGWAGQVKFSSCFVALGDEAKRALAPCTNGLDPQHHHTVDNIAEGFRRVTDTIATVRVEQTQTFKKTSCSTGGGGAAA
jgi:hypothetical protein